MMFFYQRGDTVAPPYVVEVVEVVSWGVSVGFGLAGLALGVIVGSLITLWITAHVDDDDDFNSQNSDLDRTTDPLEPGSDDLRQYDERVSQLWPTDPMHRGLYLGPGWVR